MKTSVAMESLQTMRRSDIVKLSTSVSLKPFNVNNIRISVSDVVSNKKACSRGLVVSRINDCKPLDVDLSFESISEARQFIDLVESALKELRRD